MTSHWSGTVATTVYVVGPLRAPVHTELRRVVRRLVRSGERLLILDLGRLSEIDAAGVGELVRAYNITAAAEAVLRIVNATPPVRELLERAGLLELLSEASDVLFDEWS